MNNEMEKMMKEITGKMLGNEKEFLGFLQNIFENKDLRTNISEKIKKIESLKEELEEILDKKAHLDFNNLFSDESISLTENILRLEKEINKEMKDVKDIHLKAMKEEDLQVEKQRDEEDERHEKIKNIEKLLKDYSDLNKIDLSLINKWFNDLCRENSFQIDRFERGTFELLMYLFLNKIARIEGVNNPIELTSKVVILRKEIPYELDI